MFYYAGQNATTFSLDISGWDTSKVMSMSGMFCYAGYSATTWSIGNLSGWDTSQVTSMSQMFYYAGYSATTWSIGDLSGWDTSAVTSMSNMFYYAGYRATSFSIGDLSDWNTSKVTTMVGMFYSAGYSTTSFSLDLSGWDTSAVTNMGNMFSYAGYSATTWTVIISPVNGGKPSINNDTTHLYGKTSSTYASPATGRQFTIGRKITLSLGTNVASVTIDGKNYNDGDTVTLGQGLTYNISMTPESGYVLDSWSVTGTGTSVASASANPTTITIGSAAATLTATAKIPTDTTLDTGSVINEKMLNLANGGYYNSDDDYDTMMKAFRRASSLPSGFTPSSENTISDANSNSHPVYIFFDNIDNAGIMYYYTDADTIYANPSSIEMFAEASVLADISGLADIDTSNVEDMSGMFYSTESLSNLDAISNWDTSNVVSMGMMFESSNISSVSAISGWDTSNVERMDRMFSHTHISDLSAIADWDVGSIDAPSDGDPGGFFGIFESISSSVTNSFSFADYPGYVDATSGTYILSQNQPNQNSPSQNQQASPQSAPRATPTALPQSTNEPTNNEDQTEEETDSEATNTSPLGVKRSSDETTPAETIATTRPGNMDDSDIFGIVALVGAGLATTSGLLILLGKKRKDSGEEEE